MHPRAVVLRYRPIFFLKEATRTKPPQISTSIDDEVFLQPIISSAGRRKTPVVVVVFNTMSDLV